MAKKKQTTSDRLPPLYEVFSGEELQVAQLIQRRRLQMIVHSGIYYDMNENIVSDHTWAAWAKELEQLQQEYPEIAVKAPFADVFSVWDGSTGFHLPYREPWARAKVEQMMNYHRRRCG